MNHGDALAPLRRWIRSSSILSVLQRELNRLDVPVGLERLARG